MYHISDLKDFSKCPRSYYLKINRNSVFREYLRTDDSIIDLLCQRFKIENVFIGKRNDDMSLFFENEDKYDAFEYVRIKDDELRVTVPLMIKSNGGYDVYFVYYNTQIKELDPFTYAVTLQVLKSNKIKVNEVFFVYANPDYVFHSKLDVNKALIVTRTINGKSILDIINKKKCDYKKIIEEMKTHSLEDYPAKKCNKCKGRELCPNYFTCFKEESDIPDDSVLYLVSSRYKDEMAANGIIHAKDADPKLLEGNRIQYAQIMASKNGGLFVDKFNLKNWMKCLDSFPITFVDFEWDRYLIPKYEGMKSLDVMPFEYVLYTISKKGKLSNKSFVGNLDSRKDFLKSLLHSIPRKGPIVAYNAYNAEVLRLKELGEIYPRYKRKINKICDRFVDLAEPFIEGLVYDNKMHGNFTLKKITEIVSDRSYAEFDISNGMEAVRQYREMDQGHIQDKKKTIDDLKEYCGLDAFALYLVYKWLIDKI